MQNYYTNFTRNSGFGASTNTSPNSSMLPSTQPPNNFQMPGISPLNGPSAQTNFCRNLFGQNQPSTSGSFCQSKPFGFSATPQTGLFGGQQPQQQSPPNLFGGSTLSSQSGTVIKFSPVIGTDTLQHKTGLHSIHTKQQCITCMKEYENKSLEELRFEDYSCNRKGPQEPSGFEISRREAERDIRQEFGQTPAPQAFTPTTNIPLTFNFNPKPSTSQQAHKPFSLSSFTSITTQPQPTLQDVFGQTNAQKTTTYLFQKPATSGIFSLNQPSTTVSSNLSHVSKPCTSQIATNSGFGQTNLAKPTFDTVVTKPPNFVGNAPTGSTFLYSNTPTLNQQHPSIGNVTTGNTLFNSNTPTLNQQQTCIGNVTTANTLFNSNTPTLNRQYPSISNVTTGSAHFNSNTSTLNQQQPIISNVVTTASALFKSNPPASNQQQPIIGTGSSLLNSNTNQPAQLPFPQLIDPNKMLLLASDSYPIYLNLDPLPPLTQARTTNPREIKAIVESIKKEELACGSKTRASILKFDKVTTNDFFGQADLTIPHKLLVIRKLNEEKSSKLMNYESELLKEAEKCLKHETGNDDDSDLFYTPSGSDLDLATKEKEEGNVLNPGVILTRPEYYMLPDLKDLRRCVNESGQCIVQGFTVGRKGYGNVYFHDAIDIANLNLDEIVHFHHRQVIVYPNETTKPPVGEGLNRPAQVTLDRIYPKDKETREYITDIDRIIASDFIDKLINVSFKHDAKFVEYRPKTGSWVFNVKHFSKYGIAESDTHPARRTAMKPVIRLLKLGWPHVSNKVFQHREINTILSDIIDHITPDRGYEQFYNPLKHIVENIVLNIQDFEALLVMDNFLPLIDLFQEESVRVEVCKKVLIGSNNGVHFVNDPVVVNALMFLCSILHDSVNALTPDDEYRQIGDILCHVIKTIDYGRDFEQQLTFYVEARGMFSNIDIVFVQLVQCVNSLSVKTRQIVKGLHTRKTGDFVRACAAYCFITIPSIKSVKHRLRLYLLSGQVALFNQCLGQADACFKAAANTIAENDKTQFPESELILYVKQFLALLLVVPDNPECSVLSLTRSVLNVLQGYSWESSTALIGIYLSVIDMLSVMAQEWYPYHIDKVESNDSLYGSDKKFITEVNKLCSVVTGELMGKLKALGPCTKQSLLSLELFARVAVRNELTDQTMVLALNLWNLAIRDSSLDKKYLVGI